MDLNGDGKLSQAEVLEVLRAQLPVDWHAMETELPRLWSRFDPNGDGFIERHEMMRVGGLLAGACRLYTSPSPRVRTGSRMPSSA